MQCICGCKIIPENFVKICEDELQERVLLKVPGGAAWPVDVERREGEVLLHNGWPNFAAFYSLQFGYLLVFDYIGHCNFQVRVFDTSATEINYPNLCEPSTPCKKKRARSASHKAFQSRPILKQEKGLHYIRFFLFFFGISYVYVFAKFLNTRTACIL